ncbi:MAG: hypothetical protein D6736_00925 [Nitrospinota bacterium]|nr:MAG: hypothetical protein D6736_00925 [Nitrospinota bacterium]
MGINYTYSIPPTIPIIKHIMQKNREMSSPRAGKGDDKGNSSLHKNGEWGMMGNLSIRTKRQPFPEERRDQMMPLKKPGPIIALILSIVLLIGSGVSMASHRKDTVIMAFEGPMDSLDVYMTSLRQAIIFAYHVFDRLVTRNLQTFRPEPFLAESWKIINDTTWEFKLKKGVKFHNGDPFTAESVKFSIERVIKPEQKSPQRTNWTWVDHIEVVDDHTVRFHSKAPYPLVLERLTQGYLYSPRYVKEKGDAYIAEHPMGTGPYKFVSWTKGERIVLKANEDYWGKVPAIKNLIIRIIPESATRVAELLAGGVDLIRNVEPDQIPVIEASPNARISATKILRLAFLQMDGDGRAGPTPFQNIDVRRALNYAIDREAIVKQILRGYGVPVYTPVTPLHFGYDPTIENPYSYNPQKAKELLAKAGYKDGIDVDYYIYGDRQVNEAIVGYLKKVGIRAHIKSYIENPSVMTKLRRAGKIKDIGSFTWGSYSIFDADAILYDWFHSTASNTYNTDPQMDKWLDEARSTLDAQKRKELYGKLIRFILDKAYWFPIYERYAINGVNSELNYETESDEIVRIYNASWK